MNQLQHTGQPIVFSKHPDQPGVYRLQTELFVPSSLTDVFAFFADAFQLETITPPWLNFRVLTPRPFEIQKSTLIDYKLRLHMIPIRWQSEISEWEPPYRFVDQQIRGPYTLWYHDHTFEEKDGGTLVRDVVDYSMLGGSLVNRFFVQNDLRKIFEYRHKKLREIFGVDDSQSDTEKNE